MDDLPIARVVWYDAESHDEWIDFSEVHKKLARIVSVGFLLEDEENIILMQNLDQSNEKISMTITIPGGWIEEIEILNPY